MFHPPIPHRVFFTLLISTIASTVLFAETPPSTSEKVDAEARRILSAMKESHYQHLSHIEEENGVYDVDCSGFLCTILKRIAPAHLRCVPISEHHARALALQFYECFKAAGSRGDGHWQSIEWIRDAKSGDVLVWRLPEQVAGKDTGHVMIVDEAPIEESPGLWRIVVIDSTVSPHGSDTRTTGSSGVGRGTMWLVADADGRPMAYHWRLKTSKPKPMQIVIGRAITPVKDAPN